MKMTIDPPQYRDPIAYEKELSLAGSGCGATECLEYLRCLKSRDYGTYQSSGACAEWVDSPVKTLGRYAKCTE